MSAQYQVATDKQPQARVTVESCTQAMYDALLNLGAEIDMLEKDLSPLTHEVREQEEAQTGIGMVASRQPEAIEKLGGLKQSIDAYKSRLESIRLRLAV
jgi:hypothetical protein